MAVSFYTERATFRSRVSSVLRQPSNVTTLFLFSYLLHPISTDCHIFLSTPRSIPGQDQPERGSSYPNTAAQIVASSQVNQAEGDEDEDEDEDEEYEEEDEGDARETPQSQQAAVAQQPRQHQTLSYSHPTAESAKTQYSPSHSINYRTSQQPVSPSTSPRYTHQQLPGYAQPAVPPPAQPPNQQKVRHIRTGIDGKEDEALDPRYKRVSLRSQANFFCHGRVFMMLWTEPAGRVNPGRTRGSTHFSVVKYSETAYSEIRRFVVVRNKGAFSQCVPVQTYRRQGATKVGVLVEDHAVIYTGGAHDPPPPLLEGEGIIKQALRVVTDGNETLDVCSRINFGKTYTVEHNVKVLSIGIIAPEHLHLLENYWRLAH